MAWKVRYEIEELEMKLKTSSRSWKVTVEVGKQLCFRFYFSNHNLSS